ncbi:MAG: competence/damage-inducible protein A [Acidimicrobiales bacterium]
MRCEVIAVGSELLLGQVIDTNSSWIGEQLAAHGINSHFQTKVGDNPERIAQSIELALSRSVAVIMCGGLGPTQDDITRDVIASVMGVELEMDEEIVARIEKLFADFGRSMPMNNLRQAEVPVGARTIEQMPGTAPGLVCELPGDKVIFAVPGVPREMKEMLLGTVLPELRRRAGETGTIKSRVLRTWGDSESGIAERLDKRIKELDELGNPTIAFLASGMEGLKVRITAKGATEAEVEQILADEEAVLRPLLADVIFGVDGDTMESVVLDILAERGQTLAVAESVTGGFIAKRLTDVPGASRVFRGGLVSYASDLKYDLLNVPEGPVVSEQAAIAMAEGARKLLGSDVAVATTGIAGPDEAEGQRPGTVFVGIATAKGSSGSQLGIRGSRELVREFAVIGTLSLLRRVLLAEIEDEKEAQ